MEAHLDTMEVVRNIKVVDRTLKVMGQNLKVVDQNIKVVDRNIKVVDRNIKEVDPIITLVAVTTFIQVLVNKTCQVQKIETLVEEYHQELHIMYQD